MPFVLSKKNLIRVLSFLHSFFLYFESYCLLIIEMINTYCFNKIFTVVLFMTRGSPRKSMEMHLERSLRDTFSRSWEDVTNKVSQ